jgi:hypothetical protein
MTITIRTRSFLLWIALGHLLIAWFIAGPKAATPLAHAMWVVPFGVAAAGCLIAAATLDSQHQLFAGVATIVAYASRALAFPIAWAAGWETNPGLFATVVWALLAAYALRTFRG